MKFTRLRAALIAALTFFTVCIGLEAVGVTSPIQLGASIFPLQFTTIPDLNPTDAFNQMLQLINIQVGAQLGNAPGTPGGRITLSSSKPVMTADVSAATTVYYLPYTTESVPIFNGTTWQMTDISSSGLSMGLSATNHPTTEVFDLYVSLQSGQPQLCAVYWGANTSRSTSAGGAGSANVSVTQVGGVWVNNAAIATANCFGGASGTTSYVLPANQATLLGSFYTTGNGQTSWVCKPTAASGGASDVLGISNAYNRVPASCSNRDTATTITNASATYAALGSGDNTIILDSLQQENFSYDLHIVGGTATAGDLAAAGVACTGTGTTAPAVIAAGGGATGTLADNYTTLATHEGFYPNLGLTTCYAEIASPAAVTATFMPVTKYEDFTINATY